MTAWRVLLEKATGELQVNAVKLGGRAAGARLSAYAHLPEWRYGGSAEVPKARKRKPYPNALVPFTSLFLGPPEPHILIVDRLVALHGP